MQDAISLKYCRTELPNSKTKTQGPVKGKATTFQYSIVKEADNNINVCRGAFLEFLQPIIKHRIIGVFKKFAHVLVETTGGNHKVALFAAKRVAHAV